MGDLSYKPTLCFLWCSFHRDKTGLGMAKKKPDGGNWGGKEKGGRDDEEERNHISPASPGASPVLHLLASFLAPWRSGIDTCISACFVGLPSTPLSPCLTWFCFLCNLGSRATTLIPLSNCCGSQQCKHLETPQKDSVWASRKGGERTGLGDCILFHTGSYKKKSMPEATSEALWFWECL